MMKTNKKENIISAIKIEYCVVKENHVRLMHYLETCIIQIFICSHSTSHPEERNNFQPAGEFSKSDIMQSKR